MKAVIRTYSGKGAKELLNLLEQHKPEVESIMQSVKGFVSYTLARSGDGGFSVTVCKSKAGIDESVQKAKEWVVKNARNIGVGAPTVSDGTVIVHLK